MKKLYFLILFLGTCFVFSQQNGKIVYRIKSEKLVVPEGESRSKNLFADQINKINKLRDSLYFCLLFNKNESLFFVDLKTNVGISNEKGYSSVIRSSSSTFYRNVKENLILEQKKSDKTYLINSNANKLHWKLFKDKKTINDYVCYKATTIRNAKSSTKGYYKKTITAWYCPEIALGYGPNDYGGLPGLILELNDGKLTYYVTSISINSRESLEIIKPTKGVNITENEYLDLIPTITKDNINEFLGN